MRFNVVVGPRQVLWWWHLRLRPQDSTLDKAQRLKELKLKLKDSRQSGVAVPAELPAAGARRAKAKASSADTDFEALVVQLLSLFVLVAMVLMAYIVSVAI
jgi:hypothetical protein